MAKKTDESTIHSIFRRADKSVMDTETTIQFLENIIRNAKLLMAFLDLMGNVMIWNLAAEEITGYSHEEVLERNEIWKWIYPDAKYREGVTAKINDIIRNKKYLENFETRIQTKTGETRKISWNTREMRDTEGKRTGFIVLGNDITEIARVKEDLRVSEKYLKTLFNSVMTGVVVIEADTHVILDVNPAAQAMIGADRNRIIGKVCHRFICPRDRGQCPVTDLGQDLNNKEGILLSAKGERIPILKTVAPVTISGKKILIESIVDITERKKAEETLQESEERYRNVIQSQTEFICRFLPDGTHVFANEAYCRYFGKPCEEVMGHRFIPNIPPEDRKKVRQFFESISPENPVATIEHRIIMPDGDVRWQQWNDRGIFDSHGSIIEYQSVGRDITGLKRAEAAVKESNERYLAYIKEAAMRLRTPVEVVQENIALLLEDLGAGECDRARVIPPLQLQVKNLEQIRKNIVDLNKTIVDGFGEISPASRRFLTE